MTEFSVHGLSQSQMNVSTRLSSLLNSKIIGENNHFKGHLNVIVEKMGGVVTFSID